MVTNRLGLVGLVFCSLASCMYWTLDDAGEDAGNAEIAHAVDDTSNGDTGAGNDVVNGDTGIVDAGHDVGPGDVQNPEVDVQPPTAQDYCAGNMNPARPLTYFMQNDRIILECCGCSLDTEEVVYENFRAQTIANECLSNYLHYTPVPRSDHTPSVTYLFYEMDAPVVGDNTVFGMVINNFDFVPGFIGVVRDGNTHVNSVNDVYLDLHETTHVYTGLSLGNTPAWFNEGFSEQTAGRLACEYPRLLLSTFDANRMVMASTDWVHLQRDGTLEWAEFESLTDPHIQGAVFFAALNDSYGGCYLYCAQQIWNELRRQHASGYPVTTALIRTVSERIVGQDLSRVFALARLND